MQIEFLEFKVIIYYDKYFNVYIVITGIIMFYASKFFLEIILSFFHYISLFF